MAFHEQYDRDSPACGARISATAPKCLNCGRFLNEDEDEDEDEGTEDDAGGNRWLVFVVVGLLVVGAGLAAFLFG